MNAQNSADDSLPQTQRLAPTQRLSGVSLATHGTLLKANIRRSGVCSMIDDNIRTKKFEISGPVATPGDVGSIAKKSFASVGFYAKEENEAHRGRRALSR
jgi:hypothetical protein